MPTPEEMSRQLEDKIQQQAQSAAGNEKSAIHPGPREFTPEQLATDPVLQFFHYAHLPIPLREVSVVFCSTASFIVHNLPRNAERSTALRKLLEAKDAAVRANVPPPAPETFKDRLVREHHELGERLDKLVTYIDSDGFPGNLDDTSARLLIMQRQQMSAYFDTLTARMINLGMIDTGRPLPVALDHETVDVGEGKTGRLIRKPVDDSDPPFGSVD